MRRAAIAALALGLAACSALSPPAPTAQPASDAASPGRELVEYLTDLRGMSGPRLASEAARQRQAAAGEQRDLPRVKAALALSLVPHSDEGEILALVDPVATRRGAPAEVRAMASFLHALAVQRRRLRESAAAAGTRLREERHALEQEKQRAEALQERAAQLQHKLDAISDIEKSLSDRPTPSH